MSAPHFIAPLYGEATPWTATKGWLYLHSQGMRSQKKDWISPSWMGQIVDKGCKTEACHFFSYLLTHF